MREIAPKVAAEVVRLRQEKDRVLVAIDGRCASGKTMLAEQLQKMLHATLIHMDNFFLRMEQRTPERYQEPGGNVDRERFLTEVLQPLSSGGTLSYRPFDCHTMALKEAVSVIPEDVVIIEGTYSCHPALWAYFDLRIFLTTAPETQRNRILNRSPSDAAAFETRWIPLEERYFSAYLIAERCQMQFET